MTASTFPSAGHRWLALLVGAFLGAYIGSTDWLAPIHEWYHVGVAGSHGIGAHVTSWTSAELESFNFPALFAGWSAQLWAGAVCAVVFAFIGRHSKAVLFTGAGGIGFAFISWLRAFGSYDFNDAIKIYLNSPQANLSADDQVYVWNVVHPVIEERWMIMGFFVIGIAALIVVAMVWRDKRFPQKEKAA